MTENHYSTKSVSEIHNNGVYWYYIIRKIFMINWITKGIILYYRYIELKKHMKT